MKSRDSAIKHKKTPGSSRSVEFILVVLFIVSMVLVIWGIDIYRRTIVEPKYLFLICSFAALVVAVVLILVVKLCMQLKWVLFLAACIGGGFAYFTTLYLNQWLVGGEVISDVFNIERVGDLPARKHGRCRPPFVEVDYYGYDKQLIFPCDAARTIKQYKQVLLRYKEGLFGFPVILSRELIE